MVKNDQYPQRKDFKPDGGSGGGSRALNQTAFKSLPFDHCALTLSPWSDPVCMRGRDKGHCGTPLSLSPSRLTDQVLFPPFVGTADGVVMDLVPLMAHLKDSGGKHPLLGGDERLEVKDLVVLKFHKGTDGKWGCPVTVRCWPLERAG